MVSLLESALAYIRAGLSILPAMKDKTPCVRLLPLVDTPTPSGGIECKREWTPFKSRIASEEEAQAWFAKGSKEVLIGIIGGAVSGHLEILDFDDPKLVPEWTKIMKVLNPELLARLVVERSPRGGAHIFYRCPDGIEGSQKLAKGMRIDDKDNKLKLKTIIETKGEGGYVVAYPSTGYHLVLGTFDNIPVVTAEERDVMLAVARGLDENVAEAREPKTDGRIKNPGDTYRPGDDLNGAVDMLDRLLIQHGWSKAYSHGDTVYWRRPGKTKGGISATWNYIPNRFHVFSTNADPLEDGKSYSLFALYTYLEWAGDFRRASQELRSMGYGVQDPLPERPAEPPPPDPDFMPPVRGGLHVVPDLECGAHAAVKTDEPGQEREPGEDDEADDLDLRQAEIEASLMAEQLEFPGALDGYPHIDDETIFECAMGGERGLGRLCSMLFKGILVFDHSTRVWFRWDKHYWRECMVSEQLEQMEVLKKVIVSMAIRKRPKRLKLKGDAPRQVKVGKTKVADKELFDMLIKASEQLSKLQTCKNILEFAASGLDGLGITGLEWDQNAQWVLPCVNGVVDLKTGDLRPGRPEEYIKTVCPTEYSEFATAPRWTQFIQEIMPDQDTADFLHRLFGYGITGAVSEHVFPVLWGKAGRNGKDTMTETLYEVLGRMATPMSAKTLMKTNMITEHDSALVDLRGRRFVWASESEDRQALDMAKIKLWTGGGALKGRPPYGRRQIEFKPTHKLFLISNYKPKVNADDSAFWRRMVLVPFEVTFKDDPKLPNEKLIDRELPEKLRAEKEGILRWLVEGCLAWQSQGLNPPKNVLAATQGYRSEEDVILEFMTECMTQERGATVLGKDVYARYAAWCEECNYGRPMGGKIFNKKLREKGLELITNRGPRYIEGWKLKSDSERAKEEAAECITFF